MSEKRCFKMLREIFVWTDKKYRNQWLVYLCHSLAAIQQTRRPGSCRSKNARSAERIRVGRNMTKYPKRKNIEMGDCCEFVGLNFLSFYMG